MSEFTLRTETTADEQAAPILNQAKQQFGRIPNFYAALGIDGACLQGFLAFEKTVAGSDALSPVQREQIALRVANLNGCRYCVSGHGFAAKRLGLDDSTRAAAQRGQADDPATQAMLDLAAAILQHRGHLNRADKAAAFAAGLTEQQIIQVAATVALNSFSNWVNNLVETEIDFPEVALEGDQH